MKCFFSAVLLFFLFGCGTYDEFSKRKYMPGVFQDKSSVISLNNTEVDRIYPEEKKNPVEDSVLTKTEITYGIFEAVASRKSNFHFSEENTLIDDSENEETNFYKTSFEQKQKAVLRSFPDDKLDKLASQAQVLGIFSLVSLFLVFGIFSIIFALIAVSKANRVLHHPDASDEQKRKARTGKNFASVVIGLYIAAIVIIVALINYGIIPFPI